MIGAVPTITVYEKPTCSTCRKLRALLSERGVDFESIDYHETGIDEATLREPLRKIASGPREVLRTREPLVAELGLGSPEVSDDELMAQMCAHPALCSVRSSYAASARCWRDPWSERASSSEPCGAGASGR
jgi:arsenate reductase (glutaredoxin)